LFLELVHGGQHHHPPHTDPVQFKFSLLDQAGNPVPGYSRSKELCAFWLHPPSGPIPPGSTTAPIGFDDFIKWKELHESGALKDDRFAIRCDITAIRDWPEPDNDDGAPVRTVVVPPSDLHQQLSDLLWKQKHGADVVIDVAGETFDAHGWLLAARSPVLEAELQALTSSKKEKEKESSGAARRVMKIKGMEPKVFKAMLHFMYTDALPQDEQDGDGVEMARGLLAAADRYKLERLKLMCEEALCRRIDVETVAATLVAAEEHRCQALKAACLEFMARPGCMMAVMETRGFEEMKATCPFPLLVELVVKQLA
jgi:speckle-type POZ protein